MAGPSASRCCRSLAPALDAAQDDWSCLSSPQGSPKPAGPAERPWNPPSLRVQTNRVFEVIELLSPGRGGAAAAAGAPGLGLPALLELQGRLEQLDVLPTGPCHTFVRAAP